MSYNPPMKEQILHYFRNLYYEDKKEYEKLSAGLDKLVEETKNKQWIPCSERMPEIGLDVLCFTESESMIIAQWGGDESSYIDQKAVWFPRRGWCRKDYVLAWQPLPEPFRIECKEVRNENQ